MTFDGTSNGFRFTGIKLQPQRLHQYPITDVDLAKDIPGRYILRSGLTSSDDHDLVSYCWRNQNIAEEFRQQMQLPDCGQVDDRRCIADNRHGCCQLSKACRSASNSVSS